MIKNTKCQHEMFHIILQMQTFYVQFFWLTKKCRHNTYWSLKVYINQKLLQTSLCLKFSYKQHYKISLLQLLLACFHFMPYVTNVTHSHTCKIPTAYSNYADCFIIPRRHFLAAFVLPLSSVLLTSSSSLLLYASHLLFSSLLLLVSRGSWHLRPEASSAEVSRNLSAVWQCRSAVSCPLHTSLPSSSYRHNVVERWSDARISDTLRRVVQTRSLQRSAVQRESTSGKPANKKYHVTCQKANNITRNKIFCTWINTVSDQNNKQSFYWLQIYLHQGVTYCFTQQLHVPMSVCYSNFT